MTDLVSLKSPIEEELLVCVYDLTGFAQFSRSKTSREVFQVMSDFYSMTQTGVKQAKGLLIKFIGDAGLCVFSRDVASEAIEAMINMKFKCDDWLKKSIPGSSLSIKCHVGPVTIGPITGYGGNVQIDVMGDTVNTCFALGRREFILSPQAFRSLNSETRKKFNKFTPPIIYKLSGR